MLRRLIALVFLFSLFVSLWVFVRHGSHEGAGSASVSPSDARIALQKFVYTRYHNDAMQINISADYGVLHENNLINLEGNVDAMRFNRGVRERVRAAQASAQLSSEIVAGGTEKASVENVRVMRGAELIWKEYTVSTNSAMYDAKTDLIRGEEPVSVLGKGIAFAGKDGFQLSLNDETIEVFGKINGAVKRNEL